MSFLDLFRGKPAAARYVTVLEIARNMLAWWAEVASLAKSRRWDDMHDPVSVDLAESLILMRRGVVEEVKRMRPMDSVFYVRARFLQGVLAILGRILSFGWFLHYGPEEHLKRLYGKKDVQEELQPVVAEAIAYVAESLAADPDTDINVAGDLGRAVGYPERPPFPARSGAAKDDAFRLAAVRLLLFWQHVVRLPVPPILDTLGARSVRGGFGEPYCSQTCYEAAGRAIAAGRFAVGPCEYCGSAIGQRAVRLDRTDGLVFICESCAARERAAIRALARCYRCGGPLAS